MISANAKISQLSAAAGVNVIVALLTYDVEVVEASVSLAMYWYVADVPPPALIVIDRAFVAEAPTLSATFAVKLDVPLVVGVPLMIPVEPASDSPAGRLPALTVHVRGVVPPVSASVWLYAVPTVPAGRLDVVIDGAAFTTMDNAFVAVAATLSVTFAVKLDVPDVVGEPVMAPVEPARDSPAGRLPAWMDQV